MRSRLLLLPALLLVLPFAARGEARPADRMTTTHGSTTLLRPVGKPKGSITSAVSIVLHGDHATVAHQVSAPEPTEYELLAPVSPPDEGPWPGRVEPGEPPSLVFLGPGGARLRIHESSGTGSVARLAPRYGKELERSSFVLDASSTEARRFRSAGAARVRAVWTVPYLGDTYAGTRALDCSCGDPWSFELRLVGLAVDPRESPPSVLEVANGTSATAWLRQGAKEVSLPPGARRSFALGKPAAPGHAGELALAPLSITFVERSWERSEYPRTGLSLHCTSPQEDEGAEGADREDEYYTRREEQLRADRSALRWEASCKLSGRALPAQRAPTFLGLDGSEQSHRRRDWFIRGVSRELLGVSKAPSLEAAPLLRAGLLRRSAAKPARVEASSTLRSSSDRYRALHLVDGDPSTVWCEGQSGPGRGVKLDLAFEEPVSLSGIGLLPGYVRADWLYEANGAPSRVGAVAHTASGKREAVAGLELPASAELFAEGQDALVVPLAAKEVRALSLVIDEVRAGRFAADTCLSEVFLVE